MESSPEIPEAPSLDLPAHCMQFYPSCTGPLGLKPSVSKPNQRGTSSMELWGSRHPRWDGFLGGAAASGVIHSLTLCKPQ